MSDAELRALERRARDGTEVDRQRLERLYQRVPDADADVPALVRALDHLLAPFNAGLARGGPFRRPRDAYVRPLTRTILADVLRGVDLRERSTVTPVPACGRRRSRAPIVWLKTVRWRSMPPGEMVELLVLVQHRGTTHLVEAREPALPGWHRRRFPEHLWITQAPFAEGTISLMASEPILRRWLELESPIMSPGGQPS